MPPSSYGIPVPCVGALPQSWLLRENQCSWKIISLVNLSAEEVKQASPLKPVVTCLLTSVIFALMSAACYLKEFGLQTERIQKNKTRTKLEKEKNPMNSLRAQGDGLSVSFLYPSRLILHGFICCTLYSLRTLVL